MEFNLDLDCSSIQCDLSFSESRQPSLAEVHSEFVAELNSIMELSVSPEIAN